MLNYFNIFIKDLHFGACLNGIIPLGTALAESVKRTDWPDSTGGLLIVSK